MVSIPVAPSGVTATTPTGSSATLNWTNNDTVGAPYDLIELQRWDNVSALWATWYSATSSYAFTTKTNPGLTPNRAYEYRIKVTNDAGSATSSTVAVQ